MRNKRSPAEVGVVWGLSVNVLMKCLGLVGMLADWIAGVAPKNPTHIEDLWMYTMSVSWWAGLGVFVIATIIEGESRHG